MPRSRSRSPRYKDRERHRRSRSPRPRRSRSPRRRHRSRSPGGSRHRRSPGRRGGGGYDDRHKKDEVYKSPYDAQTLTLGGSLGVKKPKKKKKKAPSQPTIMPTQPEDISNEDKMMQQIMGFGSFDTTQGKQVPGNNVYALNRKVERKYRQYMNRKGGFNRPLDFMP